MNITVEQIMQLVGVILPPVLSFIGVVLSILYVYKGNAQKNTVERLDSENKAAEGIREDMLQMIEAQGKRISSQETRIENQDAKISTLQTTIENLWKRNEELSTENYRLARRIEELESEDKKSKARIAELEAIIAQHENRK